jgi:hypothetical protein
MTATPCIRHVTLSTGHARDSSRAEVADATLKVLAPWLDRALETGGRPVPLPVPSLASFSAVAIPQGRGGLVVTLYGPAGPHIPGRTAPAGQAGIPLVTFGIGLGPEESDIWEQMAEAFGVAPGLEFPPGPWCAAFLHAAAAAYPHSLTWLGDFERCVAWAWISRRPGLRAVPGATA